MLSKNEKVTLFSIHMQIYTYIYIYYEEKTKTKYTKIKYTKLIMADENEDTFYSLRKSGSV